MLESDVLLQVPYLTGLVYAVQHSDIIVQGTGAQVQLVHQIVVTFERGVHTVFRFRRVVGHDIRIKEMRF